MSLEINFTRLALFSLLLLGLVTACSNDPAASYERSQQLLQNGDLPGATLELKSALQSDPDNALMRFALGRLYNLQNGPEFAEKELRKAKEQGFGNLGELNVELVRALFLQQKFDDILAEITVPDGASPFETSTIHALRGRAQIVLKDPEGAAESLRLALEADPRNPDAGLLEARTKTAEGDIDGALAVLQRVITEHEASSRASLFKAELLRRMNRHEEELETYNHLLKFDPDNFRGLVQRSSAFIRRGEIAQAQKDVDQLKSKYRNFPETLLQQGVIQLAQKDAQSALDSGRAALKISPNLTEAMLLVGLANKSLGNVAIAEEFLNQFIADYPNNIYGRRSLAELLIEQGRYEHALSILDPILRSGARNADTFVLAGYANSKLGNQDIANKWFDEAVKIDPDNPKAMMQKTMANLTTIGPEGLDQIENAVASLNENSVIDEVLVLALLRAGKIERAELYIDKLEKRDTATALVANLKGAVLVAQGKDLEAQTSFEKALSADPKFLGAATNLAQLDIRAGEPERARGRIQAIIDLDEKNVDALITRADMEVMLEDLDTAITFFESAVKINPAMQNTSTKLMELYLRTNRIDDAMRLGNRLLVAHPDNALAIQLTARAQLESGQTNQANETIKRLKGLDSYDSASAVSVSRFQFKASLIGEAEQTLRDILNSNPMDAAANVGLIELLVALKKSKQALEHAATLQARNPNAPLGYVLKGEIFEAIGDFPSAASTYRVALSKQPMGQLAAKLYTVERRTGDGRKALASFKQWVKNHPTDNIGRIQLADSLLVLEDYRGAIEHYEYVTDKGIPADALNRLAWAYYKIDDDRALQVAEAAYRFDPNSALIADTLGWILIEKGELDQGLRYMREAIRLAPREPELRYHAAAALHRQGDDSQAKTHLEYALRFPKFPSRGEAQALLKEL